MRQGILVFADPFRFKGFDVGGGEGAVEGRQG